jgi:hypothetical protein
LKAIYQVFGVPANDYWPESRDLQNWGKFGLSDLDLEPKELSAKVPDLDEAGIDLLAVSIP